MHIDIKHKKNLSGFTEQDLPFQCPSCSTELDVSHIIGFGEYPKGGFRSSMKPNTTTGCGCECPKCFDKSCFHANEAMYQMYIDHLSIL